MNLRSGTPHTSRELTISDARTQLFALFDSVCARAGRMVHIARRGQPSRAVLVREDYIEGLRARVHELEQQLGALAPAPITEPFSLLGSATLVVHPDAVLVESRARQNQLAAQKRRELRP